MNNYEKNKTIIDEILEADSNIALVNGKIKSCDETRCPDCDFFEGEKCSTQTIRWLMSEEEYIDWSKVPVDTSILVRDRESAEWLKRHFARYEDGRVYTWFDGRSSWTVHSEYDVHDWNFAKLTGEVEE